MISLYILPQRRKTERTANDSTIKVYSNCENVRLVVAGKDYGYGKLQQKGVFRRTMLNM